MTDRAVALSLNHRRMFFARAFLNIRMFNVVLSLFYLSRGLTLSEIFYVNIFWGVATFLFEIPSSYLADNWGRKKTLLLGAVFALAQWVIFLFGHGFIWMTLGAVFFGLFHACFSGTDSALIYDTDKELEREAKTLHSLGRYESAQHVIKIVAPLAAAFLAQDLLEWQFQVLIAVDIIATIVGIVFLLKLVEPDHRMDIQKMEAGVMADAIGIFRKNPALFRVMMNREAVFLAALTMYLSFHAFLVDRGLAVVTLGFGYAAFSLSIFLWNWTLGSRATKHSPATYIDRLNAIFLICAVVTVGAVYTRSVAPLWLLLLIQLLFFFEAARIVFFKELYNKQFNSFNRATTLSLSNMLHNFIQIPVFLALGIIIGIDDRLPYVFVCAMGVVAVLFLRLVKRDAEKADASPVQEHCCTTTQRRL